MDMGIDVGKLKAVEHCHGRRHHRIASHRTAGSVPSEGRHTAHTDSHPLGGAVVRRLSPWFSSSPAMQLQFNVTTCQPRPAHKI